MGRCQSLIIPLIATMSLIGCNLQYNMLYVPGKDVPAAAELAGRGLQFWPAGPDGYRGFSATGSAAPSARGTVVVFHGNAGTASDRDYYVAALGPLGYRVILAEYPLYGRRQGALGEKAFVADARETIRLAANAFGEPLFLLGESLGCAVAAAAASDRSLRIAGLLLITPWDSLAAVARTHYPWFPSGLFLSDRYDSKTHLGTFPGKIAIVAAERDEIVPLRHARALYESLPGAKKMWTIRGAGHNDWLSYSDGSQWREWLAFIASS